MTNLATYGFIAIGGAVGACLRFFISEMTVLWLGKGFPFGTLLVNLIGSFLLGALYAVIEQGIIGIAPWKTLVGIGLLGAFTTFSTFSVDSILLLQNGMYWKGVLNIFINVVCCLLMAWLGMQIIKGN
ncbi:fluoride efflux transporter CrcB [Alteromonas sp. a30]|uniref:fluoride efflux transporter CrcB n=1 Tax=Alteromonas sp. a30 TaxID=2730917 RepID=UPI002282C566|nr:fluoride efflux transporter CrcB [Alteromonas sp. a30]MCY7295124.1 fluoride efflux transporter CrcB [Alteromonas sp. a30]